MTILVCSTCSSLSISLIHSHCILSTTFKVWTSEEPQEPLGLVSIIPSTVSTCFDKIFQPYLEITGSSLILVTQLISALNPGGYGSACLLLFCGCLEVTLHSSPDKSLSSPEGASHGRGVPRDYLARGSTFHCLTLYIHIH